MIGKSTTILLKKYDINTIGDLNHISQEKLIKILGKIGIKLYQNVHGGNDEIINTNISIPKSISLGETFKKDTDSTEFIYEKIINFSKEISTKLIQENLECLTVQLAIKFPDFSVKNKSQKNRYFFNDSETIIFCAKKIFDDNFVGKKIRSLTIHVQNVQQKLVKKNIFS
jgi:DNA polymerase-4